MNGIGISIKILYTLRSHVVVKGKYDTLPTPLYGTQTITTHFEVSNNEKCQSNLLFNCLIRLCILDCAPIPT